MLIIIRSLAVVVGSGGICIKASAARIKFSDHACLALQIILAGLLTGCHAAIIARRPDRMERQSAHYGRARDVACVLFPSSAYWKFLLRQTDAGGWFPGLQSIA